MTDTFELATLSVRAGQRRTEFQEHSEALFLTSSFVFKSAAQAAERFANREPGNIYSRFTNPTVTMLEQRLAALEGAECCIATASGMSAILATAMGLLKAGDHIVCSAGVFNAPGLGGPGFVTDWVTAATGFSSIGEQVWVQAKAIGVTIVWSGVVAFIAYKIADLIVGLRVTEEEEREGLDVNSHGEAAYHG